MNLLADAEFHREWEGLLARCPWGTVFQSPGFVTTWFDVYRDQYAPVVVIGRAPDRTLVGALFLGRHRSTGDLVFAGTHHAEYHTFLSSGTDPDDFLQRALSEVSGLISAQGLRFHFLAPGTPSEWLPKGKFRRARWLYRTHNRSSINLTDLDAVGRSLRKKSNKSRLSRLRQLGEVQLVQLHSAAELLPFMDDIVTYCDLRQGAANRSTPFRSDPLKREFYLRMLGAPGQMHATVLLVGGHLAAAHVGPINGQEVALGLIVHAPSFAQHSPGKLIILLLAQHLAQQGFTALDLTPGGGYKERFGKVRDQVYSVEVYAASAAFAWRQARVTIRQCMVRIARAMGASEATLRRGEGLLRRALPFRRWPRIAKYLGKCVVAVAWQSIEYRIYATPDAEGPRSASGAGRVRALHLADLLEYQPESTLAEDYYAFLEESLSRLEAGQISYTYAMAGLLLHHSWLIPAATQCGTGLGHPPIRFVEQGGVLWDDYTHPSARGTGLHTESIRRRLDELQQRFPGRIAFVGVRADNRASRVNYERSGFVHVASAWYHRRAGRVRRWLEVPASSGRYFAPQDPASPTELARGAVDPAPDAPGGE